MAILTRKTSILGFLGMTVLLGACGSDSTTIDGPVSTIDAGLPTTFTVTLNRAMELTACSPGPGSATAAGTATVTISADNTSIAVTNLTYSNLSGAATLGHIHFGAPAVASGPVVLAFTSLTSPITKTFVAGDYQAAAGAPADFAAFVTAMKAGMSYINIHTANCQGGEIRGNIGP